MNTKTRQRTKAEISLEIELRQKTIHKISSIALPIKKALQEIEARIAYEQGVIDGLVWQLKSDEGE